MSPHEGPKSPEPGLQGGEGVDIIGILLFALAVSLDGLGVGSVYAIRRIHLPASSLAVIGLISFLASLLSVALGKSFGDFIDGKISGIAGGILLLGLGIWQVSRSSGGLRSKAPQLSSGEGPESLLSLLGHPEEADRDRSGSLSYMEAGLLGLALALDATCASFALGMSGVWSWGLPFLVGGVSLALVWIGLRLGRLVMRYCRGEIWDWLPGLILIGLGISRFL